jgi:nicotinamide-nucleotide amidase
LTDAVVAEGAVLVSACRGEQETTGGEMQATKEDDLVAEALRLGAWLRARSGKLGLAESCTGGWAAKALTDVPGASEWFWGGVVTYDVEAKTRLLGVSPALLAREGVVSIATAVAMATGLLERVPSLTHTAAVTGVAGPTGGGEDTPVGTVCFAWIVRGRPPRALRRCLAGERGEVRREAVRLLLRGVSGDES